MLRLGVLYGIIAEVERFEDGCTLGDLLLPSWSFDLDAWDCWHNSERLSGDIALKKEKNKQKTIYIQLREGLLVSFVGA